MKILYFACLAALLGVVSVFATAPAKNVRVEVLFDHPGKFTDVRDSQLGSDKGRDAYLEELKDYLQERAAHLLVEGQTLTVAFTDVDLAGEFEPWRGPNYGDIRVIKDIYPPRLNFTYKVVDASGALVKEGQEKLRDTAFQSSTNPFNSQESLHYEKALLDNWLRRQDWKPQPVASAP